MNAVHVKSPTKPYEELKKSKKLMKISFFFAKNYEIKKLVHNIKRRVEHDTNCKESIGC